MNNKEYIQAVRTHLQKTYGEIKPEWENPISLLEDNLNLYDEIQSALKQHGIFNPETGRRNTLLSSLKDVQGQILTISRHLGLSPYSACKIKNPESDDCDDFIDKLTS